MKPDRLYFIIFIFIEKIPSHALQYVCQVTMINLEHRIKIKKLQILIRHNHEAPQFISYNFSRIQFSFKMRSIVSYILTCDLIIEMH